MASALLANGVHLVGRSFKYHRPRGIVGSGVEEPNALLQVGRGARTIPNLRATEVELYDGLESRSVNCWPSVEHDIGAINSRLSRFLPPGFYYKAFMWPKGMWKTYEGFIRKAAGLGKSPLKPDPDYYDKMNAHCDVLVVGAGPAGLAAALEAGRTGARVILADDQSEFGGNLLGGKELIDDAPASEWVASAVEELSTMEEVRLLPRGTVFGYYDHNFLTILERRADHLPPAERRGPRERLWRVRAKEVVLAAGAIERPLVFPNNDRPGVMLASAISTYINRYGVKPGSRAVVFANNDTAYQTAIDMQEAEVTVRAVVDVRADSQGDLVSQVRERGIEVINGHVITDVEGEKRVTGVEISPLSASGSGVELGSRRLGCDLVAVSGGWNPTVHLHSQSRGTTRFDLGLACFVPEGPVVGQRSAGACNGAFSLAGCLAEGSVAGAEAAQVAGFGDGSVKSEAPSTSELHQSPIQAMWVVPSKHPITREHKQFVDLQEDVSAADIVLSAQEGYDSVELVNRYTTLGFGTDQGKLGNVNGIGILAQYLGKEIQAVGSITFRPAYTPVTIGAIAGRNVGELVDPIRKTAMHPWHVARGALFENVGQWKRPWYFPLNGESMDEAVNRECLAARGSVGLLDQSTLGKIDIQGPDSAEFLNRIYTNGWKKLGVGRCRYGLMLGEDGMVLDDGVTGRLAEDHFFMYTTTGGAANVMSWMERWLQTEWPELKVYLTSVTDQFATMSIVGPKSRRLITKLCDDIDFSRDAFPFMSFREGTVAGTPARVFRVSFTGELSFEVNVNANYGRYVWESIIEAGQELGIAPYGTESMHELRAEKAFIIVGQDTDGSVNPTDLGMDWIVAKGKDFLGKRSLSRPDSVRGDRKQMVGLLTENPVEVLPDGGQIIEDLNGLEPVPMIGHVASTYYSACLGRSIALALIKGGRSRMGDRVYVSEGNDRAIPAVISSPVFYDPDRERQND